MEYNQKIHDQLNEFIKNPTVLVTKDDIPYEFKSTGSVARLKRRRYVEKIPFQLISFVMVNNISKNQLREFASGLFLNYVEMSKIYN